MKNNQFSIIISLSLLPVSLVAAERQKPNIVVIIGDDCRFMDLGCYGSPDAITPNIDRLAAEGMQFDSFFQATAMSSPTRQCLMTGLYPVKSGAYPNHAFVKEGTKTLPIYLKELGYRVALQGKRHINPKEAYPYEYLGAWQNVNLAEIEPFVEDVSNTREPFCLFVCSNDPHAPWTRGDRTLFNADKLTLPPYFIDTKETREAYVNYLAEINRLDTDIGRVEGLLQKYDLNENTLFIFTSEQGFTLPFSKWTCYGQGLQTAFIARWHGVIAPGSKSNALCEYVDVTPTFIDIAGGKVPNKLDGKSFLPVLKSEKDNHKQYVYGIQTSRGIVSGSDHYAIRSVRNKKYSYILNLSYEKPFRCIAMIDADSVWTSWHKVAKNNTTAREQYKKYIYRPKEELYDLQKDPYEMNNLADDPSYTEIKKNLSNKLATWMEEQGDKGLATEMEAMEHMVPKSRAKFFKTKELIDVTI